MIKCYMLCRNRLWKWEHTLTAFQTRIPKEFQDIAFYITLDKNEASQQRFLQ